MTTTRAFTLATLVRSVAVAALLPVAPMALADEAAPAVEHAHHQHPAVLLQADVSALRQARTIDTNQFVVAHPARLALAPAQRGNFEHPLFALRRAAEAGQFDANQIAAQQPTAAQWLAQTPAQRADGVRLALVAQ